MGELVRLKGKDRCWRCEVSESVYMLETKTRTIGLCAACADPKLERCLSGDPGVAAKFFIPIGNGEHRRFSESTLGDIRASEAYLRELAARQTRDAEASSGLLREARQLGIKSHQPMIPFLKQMAALNWISDEGRKCLDYALAHWDMNELMWLKTKKADDESTSRHHTTPQ